MNSHTIAQALDLVKFSSRKHMLLTVLIFITACTTSTKKNQHKQKDMHGAYQLNLQDLKEKPFEAHSNYLVMSLNYQPVSQLRESLTAELPPDLKNRGEAHITVITPPEYEILKKYLSMAEINEIAEKDQIQKSDLAFVCVAEVSNRQAMKAYFVVAKSANLLKIREDILERYHKKGGSEKFAAEHFYPHITLAFTERDLHEESDHVIKDERSCFAPLSAL